MTADAACRYEAISTDGLPPEERFPFLYDVCLRRVELRRSGDDRGTPFDADMRRLVAPAGKLIDLSTTAGGLARPQRLCRADESDDIAVSLTLGGAGVGWFGTPDQTARLEPSSALLLRDDNRPYAVAWTGAANRALHLDLPRAAFDRRTRDRILGAAGTAIPPRGLSPMLAAQMHSFADIAPGLGPADRAAGLRTVLDLAATVLRLEFGSESADSEVCEDGMLVAAQALISRRFASTDLSPEEIAHRLGCSRAHLYRVFARHGLTIAGYLREVRLERCHAALAAATPRESIGDIAFRCGFDNPVYFADLFRRRYGMRPKDVRAQAQQPESRPAPETPTGDF